jgi:hypothetical protein
MVCARWAEYNTGNMCRLASLDQVALAEEVQRRQQEIRDEERRIREQEDDVIQVIRKFFSVNFVNL